MQDMSLYRKIIQRQDALNDEIVKMQLWIDNDWNEILLLQKQIDKTELDALSLPEVDNYAQGLVDLKENDPEKYNKLSEIVKNDPQKLEFADRVNRHQRFKYGYYAKMLEFFELLNNDRKELFSDEYNQYLEQLSERGWFLYYMQTPDFPLFKDIEIADAFLCRSLSSDNASELYFMLQNILDLNGITNPLRIKKVTDFKDAIDNFAAGKYRTCARTMFALLESEHKKASELKRISKGKERSEEISKYIERMGIEYYHQIWDKIDKFYKVLNASVKNKDERFINRNEIMHGDYESDVTLKDCLQLILLYMSFKEIAFNIQERNDLVAQLKEDVVLLKYVKDNKQIEEK